MAFRGTLAEKHRIPLMKTDKKAKKESKKFLDKTSQKDIDEVRKQHAPGSGNIKIFSERSPESFESPYQSLGREGHLNHPQLKEKKRK